jgi:hypothetical protein
MALGYNLRYSNVRWKNSYTSIRQTDQKHLEITGFLESKGDILKLAVALGATPICVYSCKIWYQAHALKLTAY